jgi:hypothetical protein
MQAFFGPSSHLCATGQACPDYPTAIVERETRLCAECLRSDLCRKLAELTTDGVSSINALYEALEGPHGLAVAEAAIDAQGRRFPTMHVARALLLPVANDLRTKLDEIDALVAAGGK